MAEQSVTNCICPCAAGRGFYFDNSPAGRDMKEFAKAFYKSKAWQRTRAAYAASVGGLCEECLRRGLVRAGEIVHHKQPLTPGNINDPAVALSFGNLELLCRDCHAARHGGVKRYKVDAAGRVTPRR